MFFSITNQPQNNFVKSYKLGNLYLSVDSGWETTSVGDYQIVYKGYTDTALLDIEKIINQKEPTIIGNFCAFVYDTVSNNITIKTDRYRGFPIWYNSVEITNLQALANTAWSDSIVSVNSNFEVLENKFDVIGHIDTTVLSVGEVIDRIDEILSNKVQLFLEHNRLPIHAFLSGGVDSLLVYSYIQKYTDKYKLIKCHHIDYDAFWLKNSGHLKKLWAYNQIHHWDYPCVLTSGAPGDEFMLRSPTTTNLFLLAHDTSIPTELSKQPNSLHSEYFQRDKHLELFNTQSPITKNLHWELCNIVVNDWQHWHIGNTLTYTPLRDLEIFKLLLQLPLEHAIGQILNSNISRALIERNKSGLSSLISDQKNTGHSMKNLVEFFQQH